MFFYYLTNAFKANKQLTNITGEGNIKVLAERFRYETVGQ